MNAKGIKKEFREWQRLCDDMEKWDRLEGVEWRNTKIGQYFLKKFFRQERIIKNINSNHSWREIQAYINMPDKGYGGSF